MGCTTEAVFDMFLVCFDGKKTDYSRILSIYGVLTFCIMSYNVYWYVAILSEGNIKLRCGGGDAINMCHSFHVFLSGITQRLCMEQMKHRSFSNSGICKQLHTSNKRDKT